MLWLDPTSGSHDHAPEHMSRRLPSRHLYSCWWRSRPPPRRSQCRDNFQVTKYGLISTPYCEDQQIARVARSYGFNVSDAEVHNNPEHEGLFCQIIGNDNRLKGSCGAYSEPRGVPW